MSAHIGGSRLDEPTPQTERAISTPVRLGRLTRGVLLALAVALAAVLTTARCLEPDPRGYGTHMQLGLPPCGFFTVTGQPCPSCGMTTSFAWAVRGRFDRAWRANPAGSLLSAVCALLIPWLVACSWTGRPCWGAPSVDGPLIVVVVAIVAVGLAAWTYRLWTLGRVLG